jgi:hypothetical protein
MSAEERKPRVWNKYECAPADLPFGSVLIMRGTPWGNPWAVGKDGTREQVILKYILDRGSDKRFLARVRAELRGRDLVCCCAPKACHGDWLLKIANSDGEE